MDPLDHTHELIILTKFHKDWKKIADFLLTQKFFVCALFYSSPFTLKDCWIKYRQKLDRFLLAKTYLDINEIEDITDKNCYAIVYPVGSKDFLTALNQKLLQGIKKSIDNVHLYAKIYWTYYLPQYEDPQLS